MIYVLEDGKIVESGTHSQLMDARNNYYKLYTQYENDSFEEINVSLG